MNESLEERACLYALDLLEGEERAAFEEILATSPELREEVRKFRETGAGLAHLAPPAEPPPGLRARILRSAAASPVVRAGPPGRRIRFPLLLPWAIAAGFAAAAIWLGHDRSGKAREIARLHEAIALANHEIAEGERRLTASDQRVADLNARIKSREDLARFKISTLASMLGNSPQALAVAVWDPERQEGVLTVSKLPAAASNKDYQLWVIDPHYPGPVSAGTFKVDPATEKAQVVFKSAKPIQSPAKFAVSVERKGGSEPAPQGPIVLLSQ